MHSEIQHLKNVKAEGADSKEFLLDIHYKKNNSKNEQEKYPLRSFPATD